jgi:hypothetical protein
MGGRGAAGHLFDPLIASLVTPGAESELSSTHPLPPSGGIGDLPVHPDSFAGGSVVSALSGTQTVPEPSSLCLAIAALIIYRLRRLTKRLGRYGY